LVKERAANYERARALVTAGTRFENRWQVNRPVALARFTSAVNLSMPSTVCVECSAEAGLGQEAWALDATQAQSG